MSRYVDIEPVIASHTSTDCTVSDISFAEVLYAPSIDIVRCGECKYYKLNGACMRLDRKMLAVRPNDFCSYGMRNADPNTLNTLDALDDNSSEKPNNSTISKMEQVGKE